MYRALADGDRTVRLPVHLHEKYRRIRRSAIKLSLSMGREPTANELADAVGMDPVRLAKLVWRIRATDCVEGDAPVGEGIRLMELVPDRQGPSAYDTAEAQSTKELITALLHTLTPREERVLRMRFGIGLGKDHTLQEVGDQFCLTRERIRQIEAKALRKLKHPSRSKRLRPLID
jgi:RNA polymerase primary sigma factor